MHRSLRFLTSLLAVGALAACADVTPDPPRPRVEPRALAGDVAGTINGRIAFASLRDGDYDIYLMDDAGRILAQLTDEPAADMWPRWSPDGGRIAFTSDRAGNEDVWVMNADGTDAVRLTDHASFDGHPTWSPDGRRIAFMSFRDGNQEIYAVDANGSNLVRLTNHPASDSGPAWSADGTSIAFHSNRTGNLDLFTMRPDGSGLHNLTNTANWELSPRWSPDGRSLAFTRVWGDPITVGTYDVWVMNSDGTDPVNLTNNPEQVDGMSGWSPDGARILFRRLFEPMGDFDDEVMLMDADGANVRRLTNHPAHDIGADWQPLTPSGALGYLIERVEALGIHVGNDGAVVATLRQAEASLAGGNEIAAVRQIAAFVQKVEALRGQQIDSADADAVITLAQAIVAALRSP